MILLNDTGVKKMTSNFSTLPSESYIIDLSTLSANITVSLMAKSSLEIGDYFEIHTLNSGSYNVTLDFITATEPFESASVNKTISSSTSYRFIYVGGTFGWKSIELNGGGKITQLDTTKPCALGSQFIYCGILIECTTQQSANFTFSWENFKPIIGGGYIWKGIFSSSSVYSVGDIIVSNTTSPKIYICNAPITVGSADYEPSAGIKRNFFTPSTFGVLNGFVSSTDTQGGQQGLIPDSAIGSNNFVLRNSGWKSLLADGGGYSLASYFNQNVTTIPFDNKTYNIDLSALNANGYMNLSSAKLGTVGAMVYIQKTDSTAFVFTLNPSPADAINNGLVSNIQLSSKGDYVLLIVDAENSIKILSRSATGLTVPTIQSLTTSGNITNWASIVKADASSMGGANLVATLPSTSSFSGRSISIQKMDNSNSAIVIKPNGTEKINDSTNPIYLYNQYEIATVYSDGSNSYIYNDCRNSSGGSASFLFATMTSSQNTDTGTEDHVKFNQVVASYGNKISIDTTSSYVKKTTGASLGHFSVKAGSAYDIDFDPSFVASPTSAWGTLELYNLTSDSVACQSGWQCMSGTGNASYPIINYTYNATIDTTFEIRINIGAGSLTSIGTNSTGEYPRLRIRESSRQANTISTVDYISAYSTVSQNQTGSNIIMQIDTKTEGNMSLNADYTVTLKAGKTYLLTGGLGFSNNSDVDVFFFNVTANKVVQSNATRLGTNQNGAISVHFTPTTDTKVALAYNLNSGSWIGYTRNINGWFTINQIGSTGVTNVPFNLLGGITDQSSSGYFDMGNMRIQWGVGGSGSYNPTITLPMPFKDTNYSLNVSIDNCVVTNTYYIQISTKTVTNFSVIKRFQGGNATGELVDWIAIGLKP